ncbi:zinc-binding dehydrogenase [Actinoplanes sp. NPDC048796]|uniref:zinc-binding dehydrogenase n=1 Tax=Actinoplanes sp. NPDC048796 TaxID=3155640 RepID=UPI0033FF727F
MKGLVYGGPGTRSWTEVPDPRIQDPKDAIIRIDAVTTCGTDLHILGGDDSPSHIVVIDKAESRLQAAKMFGADITVVAGADDPLGTVRELTGGLGADVAMEAVGTPQTFELCAALVRPGGRVANIGVHGKPATLHLEDLWIRNVTITTGLVDTSSTPALLDMLVAGQLDPGPMVTHRFGLDEFMAAYDVFADSAHSGALKVVLSR